MRYPSNFKMEARIRDANVDAIVDTMLSVTGTYEGRRNLAEFIMVLRQHRMTKDNVQVLHDGMEGKCDQCGMKILVPKIPDKDRAPIFGRAAELNCPEARRGRRADGASDMPLHMWKDFLVRSGVEEPGTEPSLVAPDGSPLKAR